MRVAKFGHSCLLVEAASGIRILIDPGVLSTVPDEVVTGKLDAVLITHSHGDHLDVEVIKRVRETNQALPIYASQDIVAQLAEKGISASDHQFADFMVDTLKVEVLRASHDLVLGPLPDNSAYRIDGELIITGDSTDAILDAWRGTRVLALPTIAPWGTRPHLARLMDRLNPQVVFPVHDGFVFENFLEWQNAAYGQYAKEREVQYVIVTPESLEI